MQNNSVDILGTASTLFVFDGNKSIAATPPATHKQCMDKLLTTPCISHPTAMIRKSALGAIRYNEQYQFAEDYKLWLDLAKNGAKFANLQTPLLKYNLHGGNISITKIEEQSKCARVIRREYFIYYFAGKTAALQTIKEFYRTEKLSLREVRVIIRENIDLIKFSSDTNAKILAYYLRYKIKEFFKK
ncbi:MAG: hypothetical protein FXV80_05785 [Candidatus Thioglobus sp.]|nr:MAG: hypothetical protein FXV80_05785 [Candidatus Thioglobus sp.]